MTTIYFIRHAEPNYENHDDRSAFSEIFDGDYINLFELCYGTGCSAMRSDHNTICI